MQATNLGAGISIGIISGVSLGTFALPMKHTKKWRWENTWLMYCLWSLIIFPWLLAYSTVPHLLRVFLDIPFTTLLAVFTFGFGWGIGCVLFGIGLDKVGLALGTAIVLGLNNALGALLPLLLFRPQDLTRRGGLTLTGGVVVMLFGVAVAALAGMQRERGLSAEGSRPGQKPKATYSGVLICIVAGVFATLFNFALIFAGRLQDEALKLGASKVSTNNPVWCISLLGGFVVNAGYCSYLLSRRQGWKLYAGRGDYRNWALSLAMGGIWMGGVASYGVSAMQLGPLGTSIGWGLVQSTAIISGNLCGIFTGEWKNAAKGTLGIMVAGLALLLIGIAIMGSSAAL